MDKPASLLFDFVLEKSADEPLRRRVVIYRALVEVIPSPKECRDLARMADELEAIEVRHQQLLLDLRARSSG
jgi:hypothetical protein